MPTAKAFPEPNSPTPFAEAQRTNSLLTRIARSQAAEQGLWAIRTWSHRRHFSRDASFSHTLASRFSCRILSGSHHNRFRFTFFDSFFAQPSSSALAVAVFELTWAIASLNKERSFSALIVLAHSNIP